MRRTPWFRPLASILTLWLPLILGEPSLLQPCAMHGAAVVAAAHVSDAPRQHAGHHGMADADHGSDSQHRHTNCSCIGCCTSSPAIAPSFDAPIATIVVATYPVASTPVAAAALPRPAPEYARPYTTGPPLA